jgi:hypothetical protein
LVARFLRTPDAEVCRRAASSISPTRKKEVDNSRIPDTQSAPSKRRDAVTDERQRIGLNAGEHHFTPLPTLLSSFIRMFGHVRAAATRVGLRAFSTTTTTTTPLVSPERRISQHNV